ncbi:excisionase family DNA-binding protein [Nocardia aobensis]|uniref:Excisionase family DNA-binding protein n=1 Tax=Nocardia aobensis TaxID=257277 RepID=A0ABW6P5T9_9NOCA
MNEIRVKPNYIKVSEAAEIAGVSIYTIRRRIKEGWITGYQFGSRQWHIDRAELIAALKGE